MADFTTTEQAAPEASDPQQKEIARFTKKKSKKKKLLLLVLGLVVVAVAAKLMMPKNTALPVTTAPLARDELVNRVNVSGVIESANAARVYSSQPGKVNAIRVQEGDRVAAGDVLAELDTADLELSIAKQKALMSVGSQSDALTLADAERQYSQLVSDIANGMESSLVSAQQGVDSATKTLTDAKRAIYENESDLEYADELARKLEKELILARRAKEDADAALKKDPGNAALKDALAEKTELYEQALAKWDENNKDFSNGLSQYEITYRAARMNYDAAIKNQELARQRVDRQLETLKETIEKAKLSGDMTADQLSLTSLQRSLDESTLRAPITGVVTAVYAKEGMPGTGLMFLVEDTDRLVVKTSIREYDIGSVQEGMSAVIKADATGETEFTGEVQHISPAASKAADGSTKTSGNVEFATDVALTTPDSGLRIGMNVRVNIVLEKKEGVFSAPFDAVITNDEGQDVVYVARDDGKGKYTAEAVPVTTGMETDFLIEISSDALTEGDLIITTPAALTPGAAVMLLPVGAAA
ncbi:MAG: efflux RND transporter periplasmic adaptor subunit, partial [Oscillospiraceae bacterium]